MKKSLFFASLLAALLLVGCGESKTPDVKPSNDTKPSETVKPDVTESLVFNFDTDYEYGPSQYGETNPDVGPKLSDINNTLKSGTTELALTDVSKAYIEKDAVGEGSVGALKIGSSKGTGTFTFVAPEGYTKVTFEVTNYKTHDHTDVKINDVTTSLTKFAADHESQPIEVTIPENRTIKFESLSTKVGEFTNTRCYIYKITFTK